MSARTLSRLSFPSMIQTGTVDGELVALPWLIDTGHLYYRTDLLEKYELDIPTTWEELETAARTIQEGERAEGNEEFWGYVWQGAIGEGLTCNALEWQASQGGGMIISPEGEIQVNNPEFIAALERAQGWIGDISPRWCDRTGGGGCTGHLAGRECSVHAQLVLCLQPGQC